MFWLFVSMGYVSGSILYARVFMKLFHKEEALALSRDGNPGAANAFQQGGFGCGLLTLVCDISKGLLPVHLYMRWSLMTSLAAPQAALILAAPVIGHAFPLFYRFKGGKGIAVTFGCLLGLLPYWQPVVILAVSFIVLSVIIRVTPHYYRTLAAYGCALLYMAMRLNCPGVVLGFLLISAAVGVRMWMSREEKERMRIGLWMH